MITFRNSIYCLGFLVAFTSCTEEPKCGKTGIEETPGKRLFIKVNGESPVNTRNDEPSQRGLAAPLYSAIVYLLDDSPDPVIQSVITAGLTGGEDLTVAELSAGTSLGEIQENVTQVYVVGNWNSADAGGNYADFPTSPGGTLSQIRSTVLNIEQVAYWSINGESIVPPVLVAVMEGQSEVVDYSSVPAGWTGETGPDDGDLYADVAVVPVVARLEFSSVRVLIGSNQYTNYGWFINNFYPDLPLSLETEGFPMIRNGSDATRYDPDSPSYMYSDYGTLSEIINTDIDLPNDEDLTWSAVNGRYAYHIFGNTPVPEVVFRLTGITYRDGRTDSEGYNTIRGFRDQNGNEITSFEKNRIYWFVNYDINNLTATPDPDLNGDIWVNVTVEPWVFSVVTVEPD